LIETPDITDINVIEYINKSYRPVNEKLVPFRNVCEHGKVPVIRKEAESLISILLKLKKPARILEIGTAIGYSACFFAYSCPEAEIYTIEKDRDTYHAALINIQNASLGSRIHVLNGDGEVMTRKLANEGIADFDMVFIDAAKSQYIRFLEAAVQSASEGALIIADNILQGGMTLLDSDDPKNRKHRSNIRKMNDFVDLITNDSRFETCLVSTGDGMAISVLK
jgi:predicted O-methyltransferase YrrM